MIVESPAALRLMAALMDVGSAGATREYLVRKADIGTTTFYRLVAPLVEHGLMTVVDHHYQAALSSLYGLRFKLWYDMERLYRLSDSDRNAILDLSIQTRQALGDNLVCLWVVGSAALHELRPRSDLDFLAVVRERSTFHPSTGAVRAVNFVSITEEEFREQYRRSDGFIASALRYGIVLFDRAFVDEFYAAPLPASISVAIAHEEEAATDQLRAKAIDLLGHGRLEESRNELRTYAVSLGRLMLRAFGELPANRTALVSAAEAYFGRTFSDTLSNAVGVGKLARAEVVTVSRRLADYHHSFQSQLSHLKSLASLPTADGSLMETLGARALRELAPHSEQNPKGDDAGFDFVAVGRDGTRYLIECKSVSRRISAEAVMRLVANAAKKKRSRHARRLVLVANAHRDMPPLERPEPFTPEARALARNHRVALVTGLDLLRAHNMLHLDGAPATDILRALVRGAVRR